MKDTILVVGGGSGIGREIAEEFLKTDALVIIADRDLVAWEEGASPQLIVIETDVLDTGSLSNLIKKLLALDIKLQGFVYTVGVALTMPIQSLKHSDYEHSIKLNAMAFFHLTGLLDAHSLFSEHGASIVVISSLVASTGARGKIAYAASKGALEAAIKTMALEYAESGIRINAIAPGTLRTKMLDKLTLTIGEDAVKSLAEEYPLGLGLPADIAGLAHFLLSEQSRWITGTVLTVDGGFSSK